MASNYRYEEERTRGQRGARRGGFGERGRDDDDFEQFEGERYGGGQHYGRDYGAQGGGTSRYAGSGWEGTRGEGREYGRSLGGRPYDRYGEEDYGPVHREARQYGAAYGEEERNPGQGFLLPRRGGSMQADGFSEPDEMRWGRQQGLYGSSEYRGYMSSQRAQREYQSHVGKGPKGWQRSDERIREEVSEALARHPEIDASDIEVQVQNCEVTLTGTVTERRAKRQAEDVAEDVFGVKDVQNQIKVSGGLMNKLFGDRDVTSDAERERRGPAGTDGPEGTTRRTAGATSGITNR